MRNKYKQKTSVGRNSQIKIIDLFCGAGGFSLAAQNLGGTIAAAVDNNPHAISTYSRNFVKGRRKPPNVVLGDIAQSSPSELMGECGVSSGDIQLVIGGPPCQGFSTHRLNGSGVDDPRNELLSHYFEFVRHLRPAIFVVENVPGLMWERHESYLKRFYTLARKAGYKVALPITLNARDFGVPQNRKRIFIIGMDKDRGISVQWPPEPTHFPPNSSDVLELGCPIWCNASTVFNKPIKSCDPNNVHMRSGPELTAIFRKTPKNGGSRCDSGRTLPCHRNHSGHKDVYGRINPDVPGPTMTTYCINPSKGRFVHPTEPHGITVRHAARFQTFPDKFIFEGGLTAGGGLVGNAVPVMLGEAVLRPVFHAILDLK